MFIYAHTITTTTITRCRPNWT